jgi:putative holliday junction resolvase
MEQIVALDIGEKRVGLATSDTLGLGIRPYKTVLKNELIKTLESLMKEYEVIKLVIGLPKHRDGNKSEQTLKVENFTEMIRERFSNLEIYFEDEILTSSAAKERLLEMGVHITEKNKGLIDMHAAAIILEQYFSNYSKEYSE